MKHRVLTDGVSISIVCLCQSTISFPSPNEEWKARWWITSKFPLCTISFCQNLRRVPFCCVDWISCHETQCILSLHFIDWRQRNRQEHHYYLIKSSLSSQSIFFIPSSFLFSSSSSSLLFLSLDYHPVLLFHVSSREWRKKGCSRSDKMMILLLEWIRCCHRCLFSWRCFSLLCLKILLPLGIKQEAVYPLMHFTWSTWVKKFGLSALLP